PCGHCAVCHRTLCRVPSVVLVLVILVLFNLAAHSVVFTILSLSIWATFVLSPSRVCVCACAFACCVFHICRHAARYETYRASKRPCACS
ncbi:hypothetical protein IscW_ISCW020379, partial [Ixodes scapularis]